MPLGKCSTVSQSASSAGSHDFRQRPSYGRGAEGGEVKLEEEYGEEEEEEAPLPPTYRHPPPEGAWWGFVREGAQRASDADWVHQEQSAQAPLACPCTCIQLSQTLKR